MPAPTKRDEKTLAIPKCRDEVRKVNIITNKTLRYVAPLARELI